LSSATTPMLLIWMYGMAMKGGSYQVTHMPGKYGSHSGVHPLSLSRTKTTIRVLKNFLETEPFTSTGASVIVSLSALMHDQK